MKNVYRKVTIRILGKWLKMVLQLSLEKKRHFPYVFLSQHNHQMIISGVGHKFCGADF